MPDKKTHIQDLTGRRRGWARVAIHIFEESIFAPFLLDVAPRRRWQLLDLAKFYGRLPPGQAVQGAIMNALPTDPAVRRMLDQGIPVVRIAGFPHPQDPIMPAAMADRQAAGRLAIEHLAERGFTHIAIAGRAPWGDHEIIYDAAAARAAELDCVCHPLRITTTEEPACEPGEEPLTANWQLRREQFTRCLKSLPGPVGLMAFTDSEAGRYSHWAMEAGLRVPQDVAVIGIGNHRFVCECAPVPITSIAHDTARVVQAAVDLLAQLMKGRKPKQTTVTVPPLGVVCRQSTDALAASDPRVVNALRFMWDHVTENLWVDRIAEHVGVPRRTLEQAFHDDLGRGINAEFQRRRLEKARELLLTTGLSIAEIANALSFSGPKYLGEAYRAAYGMSPSRYRRQAPPATR